VCFIAQYYFAYRQLLLCSLGFELTAAARLSQRQQGRLRHPYGHQAILALAQAVQ